MFGFYWNCLKSHCLTDLGGFEWFSFFKYILTLSVPEKLRNTIFEIPITLQTLNINNYRTTNAKSINLYIIRKLI